MGEIIMLWTQPLPSAIHLFATPTEGRHFSLPRDSRTMMHRRELLRAGVGMAGAALFANVARGDDPQDDSDPAALIAKMVPMMAKIPFEVISLGDGLELIQGPGGNIAVLDAPDGSIMIDSGVPMRAKDLMEILGKRKGKPVSVLINTHWHFDHAGGNEALGQAGAAIWATPTTRKRLATEQYTEAFKMKSPPSPPIALPKVTFEEAHVHAGGEEIEMNSVPPAHTDGDLIVHFRKHDVIHTGDLFSNGFYPNIDASSRGWIGGMIAAADRILKLVGPSTKIIPGHGPLATPADLAADHKMLVTVHDRLAPLADSGKTTNEAVAAKPTKDLDASWGKGFFNGGMFTRVAYDGLVKHRAEASK
jgi:cyclase